MQTAAMRAVVLGMVSIFVTPIAPAEAQRACKLFQGPYVEATDPGPPFVVSGRLEGGLQATYAFQVGVLVDLSAVDPIVAPSIRGVVGPVTVEARGMGTLTGSTIAVRDVVNLGGNQDGMRMFTLANESGTTVRILFNELRIPEAPFVARVYAASVCANR